MDEGKQPLGDAEQEQIQQKRQVEQAENQTGQSAIPRTQATKDPLESELDPRFDRDDLRQGKPPPAVKSRHLPRKIKIRRPRAKKGTPLSPSGGAAAATASGATGATAEGEVDEADMTEEEVEVDDEEETADADDKDDEEGGKKKSLFKKILGNNSTQS